MTEFSIPELLSVVYEVQHSRRFWRLRRELERHYRQAKRSAFRREAYVDSMMALLWEMEADRLCVSAGR